MRKIFLALALLLGFQFQALSISFPANPTEITVSENPPGKKLNKKSQKLTNRAIEKKLGRKLSLKEKLSLVFLKKKLRRTLNADEKESIGQIAMVLGIAGAALMIVGLFVPYLAIGGLAFAIAAIVTGSVGLKKNPEDRKAHAGKLLGWLTVGLFLAILLVALVIVASWNWG